MQQQLLQQTPTSNTDSQLPSVTTILKTSPISKTNTVSLSPIKAEPQDATCIKQEPEANSAQQQQQQQGAQSSVSAAAAAPAAAAAAAATVLVKQEPQEAPVAAAVPAETAAVGAATAPAAAAAPCMGPQSQRFPGFSAAAAETDTPITKAPGAALASSSLQDAPVAPQHTSISQGQDVLPGLEGGLSSQPAHQPTTFQLSQHLDVAATTAAGLLVGANSQQEAAQPVPPAAPATPSTEQVCAAGGSGGDQDAGTDADGSTGTPRAAALRSSVAQPSALLFLRAQQARGAALLSLPTNTLGEAGTGTVPAAVAAAAAGGGGEAVSAPGALVTLGSGISSSSSELPLCMPPLPVLTGAEGAAAAGRSFELSDSVVNAVLDLVLFLHKHADPGLDFMACIQALDGLRQQQAAAQRFMRVGYVALASAVRVGNTSAAVTLVKHYLQQQQRSGGAPA